MTECETKNREFYVKVKPGQKSRTFTQVYECCKAKVIFFKRGRSLYILCFFFFIIFFLFNLILWSTCSLGIYISLAKCM